METKAAAEPARVSSRRVAELFGVTTKTVGRWSDAGILRPDGHGRYSFSVVDLLTIAICRDLQRRGFKLSQCTAVANWLRRRGLSALQSEWAVGRKFLLTIGANEPFPRQFASGELFHNEHIDLAAAFNLGLPIAIIDLAAAYGVLLGKLEGGEQ